MHIPNRLTPGRYIALGFAFVIIIGSILLYLPFTHRTGMDVSFIDALFTSTSAVCVTGLIVVDTYDTFNFLGQSIIALLIQIGGIGVTSVGVGFILLAKKKLGYKDQILVKESLNLTSIRGVVRLVKSVLIMTLCFEGIGAILSFVVFSKDYPLPRAIGISLFHSVAAFNSSGFDILGGLTNLTPYQSNVLLNLTTCGLIIFGGLGFVVVDEIIYKRSFRKFSLHTKVVITMTISLLFIGTILIKLIEDISWLGAFFFSTSSRSAGFSTFQVENFTSAGLFLLILLMFIGASPGSTGGGIKTTTAFTLIKATYSAAKNKHCSGFKRKIPSEVISKAFMLTFLAMLLICLCTFLLCALEPDYTFIQLLFEAVSGLATVGFSTGITSELLPISKCIIIISMFIGRIGPLTITALLSSRQLSNAHYSEETLTIG